MTENSRLAALETRMKTLEQALVDLPTDIQEAVESLVDNLDDYIKKIEWLRLDLQEDLRQLNKLETKLAALQNKIVSSS